MKAIAVAAIAALISFSAIAQQNMTPDQVCAEMEDAFQAGAVAADYSRMNRGNFYDALQNAEYAASDVLTSSGAIRILGNDLNYKVVMEAMYDLVEVVYSTPVRQFPELQQQMDYMDNMFNRAASAANVACIQGFHNQGFYNGSF